MNFCTRHMKINTQPFKTCLIKRNVLLQRKHLNARFLQSNHEPIFPCYVALTLLILWEINLMADVTGCFADCQHFMKKKGIKTCPKIDVDAKNIKQLK